MKVGAVKGGQTLQTSALSHRFVGAGRRFKRAAPDFVSCRERFFLFF